MNPYQNNDPLFYLKKSLNESLELENFKNSISNFFNKNKNPQNNFATQMYNNVQQPEQPEYQDQPATQPIENNPSSTNNAKNYLKNAGLIGVGAAGTYGLMGLNSPIQSQDPQLKKIDEVVKKTKQKNDHLDIVGHPKKPAPESNTQQQTSTEHENNVQQVVDTNNTNNDKITIKDIENFFHKIFSTPNTSKTPNTQNTPDVSNKVQSTNQHIQPDQHVQMLNNHYDIIGHPLKSKVVPAQHVQSTQSDNSDYSDIKDIISKIGGKSYEKQQNVVHQPAQPAQPQQPQQPAENIPHYKLFDTEDSRYTGLIKYLDDKNHVHVLNMGNPDDYQKYEEMIKKGMIQAPGIFNFKDIDVSKFKPGSNQYETYTYLKDRGIDINDHNPNDIIMMNNMIENDPALKAYFLSDRAIDNGKTLTLSDLRHIIQNPNYLKQNEKFAEFQQNVQQQLDKQTYSNFETPSNEHLTTLMNAIH